MLSLRGLVGVAAAATALTVETGSAADDFDGERDGPLGNNGPQGNNGPNGNTGPGRDGPQGRNGPQGNNGPGPHHDPMS